MEFSTKISSSEMVLSAPFSHYFRAIFALFPRISAISAISAYFCDFLNLEIGFSVFEIALCHNRNARVISGLRKSRNMQKKIPFQNKIISVLNSILNCGKHFSKGGYKEMVKSKLSWNLT
jgi:hypothetical protein